MHRRRRTEILIRGSEKLARDFASEIENRYSIKLIEEPNSGLVMVKMREGAQKSLFYLGEVLVTEAKVRIEDAMGIGIVSGNKPELSYWLAVVDAAYNAGLEETMSWEPLLLEEEVRIDQERHKFASKILTTKVNFDTMDV